MNTTKPLSKASLTVISLLFFVAFVGIGANKTMIFKILVHNISFALKVSEYDDEKLNAHTLGIPYQISKFVENYFKNNPYENPVVLFEPNGYYIKNNSQVRVPEPVTFYYYTGIKGMWTSSNKIREATHYVIFYNGQMTITRFKSEQQKQEFLNHYAKYENQL